MLIKIAVRNVLRNLRRSTMTISAIAVGAMALLLFGEFIFRVLLALQTVSVSQAGHLSIFKNGYFKYGTGNPSAYGIEHYPDLIQRFSEDPILKPLIRVSTPTVTLFGIAGNFSVEASKTFFGRGVVPADYNRMRQWDEYHLDLGDRFRKGTLNESDSTHGIIGVGLARILGLCEPLKLTDCSPPPAIRQGQSKRSDPSEMKSTLGKTRDFSALAISKSNLTESSSSEARLDLLASTASGAPNVVSFYVDKAVQQGVKELDDSFVGMNLELAQQLLYGRGEKKAVAIVIQLHRTEDMDKARKRLEQIFQEEHLNLEVRDLLELQPFYKQALGMFSAIFGFISIIMAIVVLFTVINTMTMSVMERTHEIGTLRALGVKKRGIMLQFIFEGALLGITGATLGIGIGSILAVIINHLGLTWLPPGQAERILFKVLNTGVEGLILSIWLGLSLMTILAAWLPARRAARMKVVDALGHV